jgi:hypothetical protein
MSKASILHLAEFVLENQFGKDLLDPIGKLLVHKGPITA